MTFVAVFVPLLVAWAIIHRAAGRREWGFVGWPTWYREWARKLDLSNRELARAFRGLEVSARAATLAIRASGLAEALRRVADA